MVCGKGKNRYSQNIIREWDRQSIKVRMQNANVPAARADSIEARSYSIDRIGRKRVKQPRVGFVSATMKEMKERLFILLGLIAVRKF